MTAKIERNGKRLVGDLVKLIAENSPKLERLDLASLKHLGQKVIVDSLRDELRAKVEAKKVPMKREIQKFLFGCRSSQTQRVYKTCLWTLFDYMKNRGGLASMGPKEADDWILSMSGASAPVVRFRISVASSFFSWLLRRWPHLKTNPFLHTKLRPKRCRIHELRIPSDDEIESIINETKNKTLKTAFIFLKEQGVRVGSLWEMVVDENGKFHSRSKGREIKGVCSERSLEAIRVFSDSPVHPFKNWDSSQQLQDVLKYQVRKLYKAGKLKFPYNIHSFRHAFAIREYTRTHDIVRLKNLLGHSSLAVTDCYLKSLDFTE